MAYTPQTWTDNVTQANSTRLTTMENGIAAAHNLASISNAIIVASVDSPQSLKDKVGASLTCDGTADQVQVQAAIDIAAALPARNGASPAGALQRGKVILAGGQFNFSGTAQLYSGVSVVGSGWLTQVRAVSNNAVGLFSLAEPGAHVTELAHMWLDGNFASGGSCSGVYYLMDSTGTGTYPAVSPDSYHMVHDLLITNFSSGSRTGIRFTQVSGNNRGNFIYSCQIRNCSANGIWIDSSSDCSVDLIHMGDCPVGFRVAGGNTRLTNIKAYYADTCGILVTSGRCTISGAEVQDSVIGMQVSGSEFTGSGICLDTCQTDGLLISGSGASIAGLKVFLRGSGRYATQTNGVRATAGTPLIFGSVTGANITNDIVGTLHAQSVCPVV